MLPIRKLTSPGWVRTIQLALVSLSLFSFSAYAAEITATGVIRAEEEVVVRSEVDGIIWRIAVKEGRRVQKGQLLVELKNDRQKIGVELARARLLRAQASLVASRVSLENSRKELIRLRIAGDALPRKELEDMEDQVLRLQALLEVQEAELKQGKVELSLRENDLKETQLLAPFSGTVTQIYINKGDALKPLETEVLELVALDRLYVELVLPVEAILNIRSGHKVRVDVEDKVLGRAGSVKSRVSYMNPTVDASSRTFSVKVAFSDPKGNIRPGMLAQVRFGVSTSPPNPRPATD